MSQSYPPPQQPQQPGPAGANPYAQQPPAGTAAPYPAQPGAPAAPYPAQPGAPYPAQPGAFAGPPAPPAPGRNNLALGLIAAVVAALVAAGLYGVVIGLTKHEIGWAAVGVGFLIGVAAGKAGGRNPAVAIAATVLALASVYLGQLVGEAIIITRALPVSFTELFFQHFDILQKGWKADADPLTFVFFAIAAFAAFSGTKKAAA